MMRSAILVVALLGLPSGAWAQSLLSASGLGLAIESEDTRAQALGGVTLGATVPGILAGQPTAALDLIEATIAFTAQPSWGDYTLDDTSGEFQGTRFPLLGFSFPLGLRSVLVVTAGSAFDQRWSVTRSGTEQIGDVSVATTDDFRSDGGISKLQAGYARSLSPDLSVGFSLGLFRGKVTRVLTRQFDTTGVASPIAPFVSGGAWTFFGPEATLEAVWDPTSVVRLGARVSWPGVLKADPTEATAGAASEIDLPVEIAAGASLLLSPTLVFVADVETANWSNLGDAGFEGRGVGRTFKFGGGLEWSGGNFWAGAFPLRIGYQRTELPFTFGDAAPVESSVSGGFQVVMGQIRGLPLSTLDLSFEVGKRDSGTLKENFRRMSLTFRISGR